MVAERVAMQYRLVSVLLVMAVASVLFALVFTSPAIVTLPVLTLVLWVSPSVWIAGIVYARGWSQAFFIGGLIAGAIPFLIVAFLSAMYAVEIVADFNVNSGNWTSLGVDQFADRAGIIYYALILLSPGLFSFIGGLLAVIVYGMNRPEKRV